ncbi:iron-containing alcohol dehydrogenase [Cytobacillus oceanisediminis]|uniref:iron-containing alcohol dehydrogenase n=1 Tax=Cytobacillus TaxID=2675230 RepID=UPI0020423ACF|nr:MULTISPECIES: iron-containing alcohol dehydrogenase [Cytobacillus]MBY0155101.1 iron-containing alcohol dehydrogenase [Cytobacillus firmus]MCM3393398.1 iron-containing alcohol dehydrogenase [Cytobacillus oceanisediminis]MCM3530497.1 iron-containing alcohol dehydrogenase [Cytobacillus oceanisediminis]UQX54855.1 iron-containing alcohol dehydrogenase [Cytobacillus pseudoceanisediminis]
MYKTYCRMVQKTFKLASPFLPWRKPELLEGPNSLDKLPDVIKKNEISRILIVTDSGISGLGLMDGLLSNLQKKNIEFYIYDKTIPNPTNTNIEEALEVYKKNDCQGIIAFGGGSPMDCAKGVGARVMRPEKSISQMKGQFKVRKELPPIFAVPTTAGTGSEATVAAVITDSSSHEKYAIIDLNLIPHYAVLDPLITLKMPPHITAATGMDALTHAIEAYIGRSNTAETRKFSINAVRLIYDNLYETYQNGENLTARANMQKAAYLAGLAFTRAYVGNVHAIAHTLGGFYSVPHGLANAVILPYVLEHYGEAVWDPLAELAVAAGIGNASDSAEENAKNFILSIKSLNSRMGIPPKVSGIQDRDIPIMAERALKEANPLYPVPKIFSRDDMFRLYQLIKD